MWSRRVGLGVGQTRRVVFFKGTAFSIFAGRPSYKTQNAKHAGAFSNSRLRHTLHTTNAALTDAIDSLLRTLSVIARLLPENRQLSPATAGSGAFLAPTHYSRATPLSLFVSAPPRSPFCVETSTRRPFLFFVPSCLRVRPPILCAPPRSPFCVEKPTRLPFLIFVPSCLRVRPPILCVSASPRETSSRLDEPRFAKLSAPA